MTEPYRRDRRKLVERLRQAGVDDMAVLHAFDRVPRHRFVPEAVRHRAYEVAALPIGHEQTISRPTVHASHLALAGISGGDRVLEVGTGSGFQTALLAELGATVYSVERVPELAERAREILRGLGVRDVTLRTGDGSRGWPDAAPFDAVLVGAAAPEVPDALTDQLAEGGRMIVPVGDGEGQRLLRIRRRAAGLQREEVQGARFVPLVGEEGW